MSFSIVSWISWDVSTACGRVTDHTIVRVRFEVAILTRFSRAILGLFSGIRHQLILPQRFPQRLLNSCAVALELLRHIRQLCLQLSGPVCRIGRVSLRDSLLFRNVEILKVKSVNAVQGEEQRVIFQDWLEIDVVSEFVNRGDIGFKVPSLGLRSDVVD